MENAPGKHLQPFALQEAGRGDEATAASARLDSPPDNDRYVRFPASFGRRFTIFVDTEEEFDWGRPLRRENRDVTAIRAMPAMHERMRAAGAKPVYLVDHPIAAAPEAVAVLRPWAEKGECTIGTQLHPWVNPPFDEEVNPFNSYTGNLPLQLQRAKLAVLTDTIERAFGVRPAVYRAGRYGVGARTAALLEEAGYTIDLSVRALFDYRRQHGPNFAQVRPQPYWVGDGGLLEVPLSAAFTGRLRRAGGWLFPATSGLPRIRSVLARTGLLARIALTPEDMPLEDVRRAIAHLLADGAQHLSISFHSPSVAPGHTPYVRTAADLAAFHAWWDGLFETLDAQGIEPASIEDVLAAARASRDARESKVPSS